MLIYWAYKYEIEDRDIGVVDYVSLQHSDDIPFPVLSICLVNPINEKKLKLETNGTISTELYLKFLKGEAWSESLARIDYQFVTLNLNDYLDHAVERSKYHSHFTKPNRSFTHIELFGAFIHERFMKCFTIETDLRDHRHIQTQLLHCNRTKLTQDWSNFTEENLTSPGEKWEFFRSVHHPGQLLLAEEPILSNKPPNQKNAPLSSFDVWISDVEILKRRNSRRRKCSDGDKPYDLMILKNHIANHGCRPPYFNLNSSFPLCNTMEKINHSKFSFFTAKSMSYPEDCQQMRGGFLDPLEHQQGLEEEWQIYINYPVDVKLIIQHKEVDIHGLIGNCGGYIGLFLGKNHRLT